VPRTQLRNTTRLAIPAIAAIAIVALGCGGKMAKPGSPATPFGPADARPLNPTPADEGLTSTRRALEGTWELISLESEPPGGGPREPVKATGTLVYDQFGNLTINARTTDPAAPVAAQEAERMQFKGRAVIDIARKELKLMDLTGNVDPNAVLSPERRRRYELTADTLTLSSFDERDRVTAIATWRRRTN
jgi:hypothetical protein